MGKVRKFGTCLLLIIMILGMCVVLTLPAAWRLKQKGYSNDVIDFLTEDSNLRITFVQYLPGHEPDYADPLTTSERIYKIITSLEDTIDSFCTSGWPKNAAIKEVADTYKEKLLSISVNTDEEGKTIEQKASDAANQVISFSEYCKQSGINFIYVNIPGYESISGKEDASGLLDASASFLRELRGADVAVLDVAKDTGHKFSLESSGHWMPENALYTTGVLAETLNDEFEYSFDVDLFDEDNYYNHFIAKEPSFAELVKEKDGYEYNLPVPKNSPQYCIMADSFDTTRVGTEGNFVYTYLKNPDEWADGIAYYNTSWLRNGYFYRMQNNNLTNNEGKRLLFLGDSFTWYIVAYLSQDVDEISYTSPGYFAGSVYRYIEDYKPDTIVWAYYEGQLTDNLYDWVK